MSALNYKHLRYFWMVAKTGSIAKAASQLNLTPHSISGQLSEFADVLGVALFVWVLSALWSLYRNLGGVDASGTSSDWDMSDTSDSASSSDCGDSGGGGCDCGGGDD